MTQKTYFVKVEMVKGKGKAISLKPGWALMVPGG